VAIAAASLASLAASQAPASAAAPNSIHLGDLGPCQKSVHPKQMRCGRLRVPLERADPSLGTIRIAYAVRPRDVRKKPSKGTVVAVEGGPGYGSIGGAFYYSKLFAGFLKRRELLLVDTRGTGYSEAIDCKALQRGKGTDREGVTECAGQLGDTYGSYRTAAAADDLDAVRQELGLDSFYLYGDSYGTFLGQSYAFRHGDTLEALVLDSAYPIKGESAWYANTFRTGIKALGITCKREPSCPPGAERRLDRFVRLLRSERGRRLELGGVGPLLDTLGGAGNYPYADNYLRIERALRLGLRGRFGPYRKLVAPRGGGGGSPRAYSAGLEVAMSCNDYPVLWHKATARLDDRKVEREAKIRAQRKDRFLPFTPREIGLKNDVIFNYCLHWPVPTSFYEFPGQGGTPTTAPTLVVSGELDNVTTPREGRVTASLFPDSEFFLARNVGHVAALYDYDGPAARKIRAFLRDP
jgi:pimeloyl-ACP methyl ester carboxylesterase